jgi:pimeloyl-ACP methyl ester carboxylesterase
MSRRLWVAVVLTAVALGACGGDDGSEGTTEGSESPPAQEGPADGIVDVGGRRLELDCRGEGTPTVVFESGLGNDRDEWARVQNQVADLATACTYSRAGLGRSDPAPHPRDGQAMVTDLGRLVDAAQIERPIVLVGASWGGMLVRAYAAEHPDDVSGVVLVDSASPGQLEAFSMALAATMTPDDVAALEEQYLGDFERNGEGVTRAGLVATEAMVAPTLLGDAPLVVLSHGRPEGQFLLPGVEGAWQALQAELAELSTDGRVEVVPDAGHMIAGEAPDAVVAAVRSVLG